MSIGVADLADYRDSPCRRQLHGREFAIEKLSNEGGE
jgi:hypothetical protein